MRASRVVLCGGLELPGSSPSESAKTISLDTSGCDPNVNLRIHDFARSLSTVPSARLVDALELAAYVFTADVRTPRGSKWDGGAIEPWTRDFHFVMPVRDHGFWSSPQVSAALRAPLEYLTDDRYSFEFHKYDDPPVVQSYLELGKEDLGRGSKPRVVLFSGGLDSLAGAAELANAGHDLLLVSHRSVAPIGARQRRLIEAMRTTYPGVRINHVPVWVNKSSGGPHEPTQRTRSFLFALLGVVTASMTGANEITFFENGIVSLNLPVADEVVRARASRTTNPLAIARLAAFCELLTGGPFTISTPYLYSTKTDVVTSAVNVGAGRLIGLSVSCAHTMFKTKSQQHCGLCSQCIDRRMAIVASEAEDYDPLTDYVTDVFMGHRAQPADVAMAVHFVRHATELDRMSEDEFALRFNLELSRALRGVPNVAESASSFFRLHKRHAASVMGACAGMIKTNAEAFVAGGLPPRSLLGLVAGGAHNRSMWEAYAERIANILQAGLPRACVSQKPDNEPRLQEIADGILAGHELNLVREFPFVRWSGAATKPDWANEELELWVEMKFVRKRADILPITRDIAEDITKYGDSGKRTLFVVYDPSHFVVDEEVFAAPVASRAGMFIRFIR